MNTALHTRVTWVGSFEQLGDLLKSSSDSGRKREHTFYLYHGSADTEQGFLISNSILYEERTYMNEWMLSTKLNYS